MAAWLLVAARSDRGNSAVSAQELREFAARLGVEAGFVETSALTGDGLPQLARVLRDHVRWDDLPMVVETPALTAVKAEVLRFKEQESDETPLVPVAGPLTGSSLSRHRSTCGSTTPRPAAWSRRRWS